MLLSGLKISKERLGLGPVLTFFFVLNLKHHCVLVPRKFFLMAFHVIMMADMNVKQQLHIRYSLP